MKISRSIPFKIVFPVFTIILFLAVVSGLVTGSGLSAADSLKALVNYFSPTGTVFSEMPSYAENIILTRLARILLAVSAGASLAVSGAVLQSLLRNPLADPYFLGVSAGASLGSALVFVLPIAGLGFFAHGLGVAAAFAGSSIAVFTTLFLASRAGGLSGSSIILAGIAVSTLLTAIVSGIMIMTPNYTERIVFWNLGSFANATWDKVIWTSLAASAGFFLAMLFSRDLNLLLLGEEHAHYLGLNVGLRKKLFLLVSAFMASAAVASCGIIAFAGLVVPNIIRHAFGSDNRKLLPLSALAGAAFLLVADTLSRTLFSPVQVPVSIFTALAGAPFFAFLLAKNKFGKREKT